MTPQTGSNKKRTKGGQMTAFLLTAAQRATVDQFLQLGQQLDKEAEAVLQEAEKVKGIFDSKPRGTAIDGCRTFDEFIDKYFPVSSSTVRRLLRKEGKTDKRFANKKKDNGDKRAGPWADLRPAKHVSPTQSEAEIPAPIIKWPEEQRPDDRWTRELVSVFPRERRAAVNANPAGDAFPARIVLSVTVDEAKAIATLLKRPIANAAD